MAIAAVPGYAAKAKAARALFYNPPALKPKTQAKTQVAGGSTLGTGGTGALVNNPAGGGGTFTPAQPTVRTDYQDSIKQMLAGLGLGGNSNLNNYVPPTEYQGEIASDPEYQLGLNSLTNTQNSLAQARANAFRQNFIKGGFGAGTFQSEISKDPSLAGFAGDIDADTLSAAAANQMSTKAQLDRQLAQGQAAIPYQLAARGVARSGAAATRSSDLQRGYDEQSSQQLSSLLDALRGVGGDYTSGLVDAANQWEQKKSNVALRLAQTQGYSQPTQDWGLDDILSGLSGILDRNTGDPQQPSLLPPAPAGQRYSNSALQNFVAPAVQNYQTYTGGPIVGGPTMGRPAPKAPAPPKKATPKKKGK